MVRTLEEGDPQVERVEEPAPPAEPSSPGPGRDVKYRYFPSIKFYEKNCAAATSPTTVDTLNFLRPPQAAGNF